MISRGKNDLWAWRAGSPVKGSYSYHYEINYVFGYLTPMFYITQFNQEFLSQLRRCGLTRLAHPMYENKIKRTLERFTTRNGAKYRLTGLSPYTLMNREMNAEIRFCEFVPVVIEKLTADGQGFTFEKYVIHLASFIENGRREIIN